ncbi:MAG: ABC transporter permease [Clostridium sp.]
MRNMLLVMKNNLYRFSKDKVMIVMGLIIMPIVILLGLYFSSGDDIKGNIAMISVSNEAKEVITKGFENNDKFKIEYFEESVSKTSLIKGIYIAQVDFREIDNMGVPKITSYGNEEIKKAIESIFTGAPYEGVENKTTVVGKVIGFLIMFLLMGGVSMVMEFFLCDKENGTYTRVLSGNTSYFQYMCGQLLYSIVVLTTPATLWTVGIIMVLGINIEISYVLLGLLVILLGILSGTFAMFIATIFKDRVSASMGGSIIVMITSLFGGCLVNIEDSNKIIGFIRGLLPQKRMIDLANKFNLEDLAFIIVIIFILLFSSIIIGKKQYESGEFINS